MKKKNKKQKKHRRIDHWEHGVPIWTDIPLQKTERPVAVPTPTNWQVIDGKVTIFAEKVVKETEKAILVKVCGTHIWIAKSLLAENERGVIAVGDTLAEITIPEWLAIEKGLIE